VNDCKPLLLGAHDFLGSISIPVHLVEEGTKVGAYTRPLLTST